MSNYGSTINIEIDARDYQPGRCGCLSGNSDFVPERVLRIKEIQGTGSTACFVDGGGSEKGNGNQRVTTLVARERELELVR